MNIFIAKNKKGFTLIELLLVISIISFLSSVVLVSVGVAREKAVTAKITEDLRQVKIATELAYGETGEYIFSVHDNNQNDLTINTTSDKHDTISLFKIAHAQGSIPAACQLFNTLAADLVAKKYLNSVPVHPRQDYEEGICYKAVVSAEQKTLAVYAETPARVNLTVSSPTKKVGFVVGDTSIENLNEIHTQSIEKGGGTGYLQTLNGSDIATVFDIADEVIGVTGGAPSIYLNGLSGGLILSSTSAPTPSIGIGTIVLLSPSSISTPSVLPYGVCGYGAGLLMNGVCQVWASCPISDDGSPGVGPCYYYPEGQYGYRCPIGQTFVINGYQNTINGTCISY